MSELTPRQELFCQEYVVDLNATQAAIRAGYAAPSAAAASSRLLTNVKISVRVAELAGKRTEQVGITAERVLGELMRIATVDIGGAFDASGALLPIHDMPADVRRCISGIEVDEILEWEGEGKARRQVVVGYTRKVKFWDKKGSLDSLGRYLKLFIDRIEHGADESFAQAVAAAFKK